MITRLLTLLTCATAALAIELPTRATVELIPKSGSAVTGMLTLEPSEQGILVRGRIQNLAPGPHGFHVHQFGDCTAPDAESAGAHFNPADHEHGAPTVKNKHAGDLGNIQASPAGIADVSVYLTDSTLPVIIGRSIVVHQKEDDFKTQPTGASGPRIACGVIGLSKPTE